MSLVNRLRARFGASIAPILAHKPQFGSTVTACTALSFLLLSPPTAHAQNLVVNGGFEDLTGTDPIHFTLDGKLRDGHYARQSGSVGGAPTGFIDANAIPGWQTTDDAGTFNPTTVQYPSGISEGQNLAFTNGPVISQVLSATLTQNTRYDLSVDVGQRSDGGISTYSVRLFAGSMLLAQNVTSPPLVGGAFATISLEYIALSSDPNLGMPLQIQLSRTNVGQGNFDNVILTGSSIVAVPETGTIILLGCALAPVAFGLVRRRNASING